MNTMVKLTDDVAACGGRVMTVEEAAHRIGISPRTMRRVVAQRLIRHVRIGRLVRLDADDVEVFVSKCTVEAVE